MATVNEKPLERKKKTTSSDVTAEQTDPTHREKRWVVKKRKRRGKEKTTLLLSPIRVNQLQATECPLHCDIKEQSEFLSSQ